MDFSDGKKGASISDKLGNIDDTVGGALVKCQSWFSALHGTGACERYTVLKVPSTWPMTKKCLFSNCNPHCALQPCCSHWKELRHRGKLAFLGSHLFGLPLRCQEVETWYRQGKVRRTLVNTPPQEHAYGQSCFPGFCFLSLIFRLSFRIQDFQNLSFTTLSES